MPEADGSEATSDFIKKEFSVGHADEEKEATDEVIEAVKALQKAKADKKDAEKREAEFSNRIKVYMGDATVIPGVCTWKNNKDGESIDWESIATIAMAGMDVAERAALIAQHTAKKTGNRVLRITAKGI